MITRNIEYFNLRKIMNSGQIFRMYEPETGHFVVFSGNRRLELCQDGESIDFMCTQEEYDEYWEDYFDLKRDYGAIVKMARDHYARISREKPESMALGKKEGQIKNTAVNGAEFLKKSCEYGADIRVLKQDIWEMMISFIISQQKQIPSIRKCIEALCERFGEKHGWYGFPTAESIASASPEGLKGLSLGYRERYIYETAVKYLTDGISDDELRHMDPQAAKKYLCSFTGIGDKVADCICLFGCGFTDAFPIDVHIKDILFREFVPEARKKQLEASVEAGRQKAGTMNLDGITRKKLLEKLSYQDYMRIIEDNFSPFSGIKGIVQQWIFAYEISHKL